jgi:hypothetical protein
MYIRCEWAGLWSKIETFLKKEMLRLIIKKNAKQVGMYCKTETRTETPTCNHIHMRHLFSQGMSLKINCPRSG